MNKKLVKKIRIQKMNTYLFLAGLSPPPPPPPPPPPMPTKLLPCNDCHVVARINWSTRGHGVSLRDADEAAVVIQRYWRRHYLDAMDFHEEVRWRREVIATRFTVRARRLLNNLKYAVAQPARHARLLAKMERCQWIVRTMLLDRQTCKRYRGHPILLL